MNTHLENPEFQLDFFNFLIFFFFIFRKLKNLKKMSVGHGKIKYA